MPRLFELFCSRIHNASKKRYHSVLGHECLLGQSSLAPMPLRAQALSDSDAAHELRPLNAVVKHHDPAPSELFPKRHKTASSTYSAFIT